MDGAVVSKICILFNLNVELYMINELFKRLLSKQTITIYLYNNNFILKAENKFFSIKIVKNSFHLVFFFFKKKSHILTLLFV